MNTADRSVTRALTARCLFALGTVAALALANYLVLRAEIRAVETGAEILNISGRQRMLLHHTALSAQALVTADAAADRARHREELLEAIGPLETAHHRLNQLDSPGGPPPEVQEIYESTPWLLDIEIRNYLTHLRELARSDDGDLTLANPHQRYIRDVALKGPLMDGLDAVVAAYQARSEEQAAQLRHLARWSFASTLVVLGLTGAFVFRPMVRRVRHDMAALHELNETLEQRVAERAALAEQRARELLHAERLAAVGEMVTGVAHESRNALQQIGACAKMLEWEVNGRGEAAGLIADVQKAHDRLHRLFENLRGYVSPLKMEHRLTHLPDVLQEAWRAVAPLREGRDVTLRERCALSGRGAGFQPARESSTTGGLTTCPAGEQPATGRLQTCPTGDAPVRCLADPFRLEQVFRNILENSLAACDDPVRIEVGYKQTTHDGAPAVEVTVADNGPGLTPEAEARIFEPFFTTKTQGTGLGMAIVKRIVEGHGGKIEAVRPAVGRGVELRITLPGGER